MRYTVILATLLAITLLGCGKKEVLPDPYISAFADDFPFFASGEQISTYKSDGGTYTSLEIEGVMASGATMKLWVRNFSGALDSVSLDSTGGSATFLPVTPSVAVTSLYGKLVITSATPTLDGRYEFTCTDSTKVSGTFKVLPE